MPYETAGKNVESVRKELMDAKREINILGHEISDECEQWAGPCTASFGVESAE